MVRGWIRRIKKLLDLVYFLGFKKLKDVLVLSISVPLFLPCRKGRMIYNLQF